MVAFFSILKIIDSCAENFTFNDKFFQVHYRYAEEFFFKDL